MLRKISLLFAAGCLGGVINSLTVWGFGVTEITTNQGVSIAPQLTPAWLYPRIVWGGLWGVLFFISWRRHAWLLRGLVFSLGPTLVQLFIIFPYKADKGMAGLDLGSLTPVFVIFFNAVWGVTTACWLKLTRVS